MDENVFKKTKYFPLQFNRVKNSKISRTDTYTDTPTQSDFLGFLPKPTKTNIMIMINYLFRMMVGMRPQLSATMIHPAM